MANTTGKRPLDTFEDDTWPHHHGEPNTTNDAATTDSDSSVNLMRPPKIPKTDSFAQSETYDFYCVLCLEHYTCKPACIQVNTVCEACVVDQILPQFYDALKYETKHPVQWENVELQPEDYEEYFEPEGFEAFIAAWNHKMTEYHTPPPVRLYCFSCEQFLGRRVDDDSLLTTSTARCTGCDSSVCGKCGKLEHTETVCETNDTTDLDPRESGDCRRCPNPRCARLVYLYDGCNHVACTMCKAEFCWVCGHIDPTPNHWIVTSCPHYGPKDSDTYDEEQEEDEEEEDMEAMEDDEDEQLAGATEDALDYIYAAFSVGDPKNRDPFDYEGKYWFPFNLPSPQPWQIQDDDETMLRQETVLTATLLDTQFFRTMTQHRETLQSLLDEMDDGSSRMFTGARSWIEKLPNNLNIYILSATLVIEFLRYDRRHRQILEGIEDLAEWWQLSGSWVEDWPVKLYPVLDHYFKNSPELLSTKG